MDDYFFQSRILVISPDEEAAAALREIGRALGAEVSWVQSADATGDGWDAVCADEDALGVDAAWLARFRQTDPHTGVLWLTREPRGSAAEAALEKGADDVVGLPAWMPEVRNRLGRLLGAARDPRAGRAILGEGSNAHLGACAAALAASQQNLRDLYGELEAHTRDLQALLDAQEALIPLARGPAAALTRLPQTLSGLFPGARVEVTPGSDGGEPPGSTARRITTTDGTDRWTSATIPLAAGEEVLGVLRLRAPSGVSYSRRKLDLLDVWTGQAAQALHRNHLYEVLSQGKAEWERTFDAINDSISVIGPDHTIRRANRALARLVGKEPGDLVGRRCHEVLHGSDAPCPHCPVARAFETGEMGLAEGRGLHANRLFDYCAYPLKDEEGRVRAVIAYARDVTQEERLKASLLQSDKLLILGQIAAGIAHEINDPLTSVSSYAQLLGLRLSDPKALECASRIRDGIERIHRLVRNLTSFVHPTDETFYPLDVNQIVAETLSFSLYDLTRGEARLVQELSPDLPKVLGVKDHLEHLLVNLLTNARDALGGRGTMTVRTSAANGNVSLQVEDDGIGMAPAERDRIFEPFFTTKPTGKGTGLGLFIAAGIARKHRAEITVASEPGGGTVVTVTLPAFDL